MDQLKAECPFPEECVWFGTGGCMVRDRFPLVSCSMAQKSSRQTRLDEKAVREYLKRHIAFWRGKRKAGQLNTQSVIWEDAYRKVHKDLFESGGLREII